MPVSLKSDRKFLFERVRTAKNWLTISKISFFKTYDWDVDVLIWEKVLEKSLEIQANRNSALQPPVTSV